MQTAGFELVLRQHHCLGPFQRCNKYLRLHENAVSAASCENIHVTACIDARLNIIKANSRRFLWTAFSALSYYCSKQEWAPSRSHVVNTFATLHVWYKRWTMKFRFLFPPVKYRGQCSIHISLDIFVLTQFSNELSYTHNSLIYTNIKIHR